MPKAVTLIRSDALSDAAQYAYAATAPAEARLIFLAGSRPLEKDGVNAERILTHYRRVKFDPSSVV